jgi:S1-C subfamily serine protease
MVWTVALVAMLLLTLGAPLALAQTGQTDAASEPGLVIVVVDPDGPAAEAGVKRGDILLAIDGQEINQAADWFRALRGLASGQDIELTVMHGDEERTLSATIAERNSRPFLGLQVYLGGSQDATDSAPPALPLASIVSGAQVVEVVDDSPASAAGLQVDDVITAVDGKTLDGEASLADVIGGYAPGDEVTLSVTRPGAEEETLELSVILGENPDDADKAFLGIRYAQSAMFDLQEMPEGFAPFFGQGRGQEMPFTLPLDRLAPDLDAMPGMTMTEGAVVLTVVEQGPAEEAGLQAGDVITAIDGEAVDGPQALVDAVTSRQPGDAVVLTVTREGDPIEIEAVLGEHPDDPEKAYLGVSIGAFMMRMHGQGRGTDGQGFSLPFDLDQLPFDLDQLPFDLDKLPFDLPFELPGQLQQPAGPQA